MWFLVEITINYDGVSARALWERSSMDDAVMALYQGMAYAIANPDVHMAMFMIIDEAGRVLKHEHWVRS